MRTYVDYSHFAQEFSIAATLTIEDDGRFSYDEAWSSYGGIIGGAANGIWWQYADALFFRCDYVEGVMYLEWTQGQTRKALEQTETIDFGGDFTMSLRKERTVQNVQPPKKEEPVRNAEPPKKEEGIKQEGADKKRLPTIARLHFKDGRILEKLLPNDPLYSLFDEMYYRLVDENGEQTNVFKPRQNSKDPDSQAIEYDEI